MRDYKYQFHKLTQSGLWACVHNINSFIYITELNFNGDTNTGFFRQIVNESLGQFGVLISSWRAQVFWEFEWQITA